MAEEVAFLSKDYKDGGIFILSEHEDKLIRSSIYEESQLYSECKVRTELGYDLALSPDDDVASKNPGYEAVLGAINKINN